MSRRSQLIINNISYVPVVNPETITGVSLMLLFVMAQSFGIGGESGIFGWPTLLIAHITFNIPFTLSLRAPSCASLTRVCTTPRWTWLHAAPGILQGHHAAAVPGNLSAFPICLTYSIDDFMISYFNSGTMQTLPIAIYLDDPQRSAPEINALSAVMFCVILAIILDFQRQGFPRLPPQPERHP